MKEYLWITHSWVHFLLANVLRFYLFPPTSCKDFFDFLILTRLFFYWFQTANYYVPLNRRNAHWKIQVRQTVCGERNYEGRRGKRRRSIMYVSCDTRDVITYSPWRQRLVFCFRWPVSGPRRCGDKGNAFASYRPQTVQRSRHSLQYLKLGQTPARFARQHSRLGLRSRSSASIIMGTYSLHELSLSPYHFWTTDQQFKYNDY